MDGGKGRERANKPAKKKLVEEKRKWRKKCRVVIDQTKLAQRGLLAIWHLILDEAQWLFRLIDWRIRSQKAPKSFIGNSKI